MDDSATVAVIAFTFLLAGGVKGVIGLGLPSISLGLLTAVLGLQEAIVLMLVPSFVTNAWQASSGGHGRAVLKRTWPFLVTATAAIALGAQGLSRLDLDLLSALLGALLAAYATLGLRRPRFALPRSREPWAGPLTGLINGILTGLTGSFVVPGVLYLQAIGLSRDALVQAMGILFTLSTLALGLALGEQRLMNTQGAVMSCAAVAPALAGMMLGRRLRRRLSEQRFRQVFFTALLLLGLYILLRSLA